MLIKFGDIVAQASGSVRGTTYSRNRYGAYVRDRAVPVNPNSARQSTVRTVMQSLTALWLSTVTSAQRAAWNNYAANTPVVNALGDTIYLTGFNHYIRSNVPRIVAGLDRVDAGPVINGLPETDETVVFSYTADDQKCSVAFDDTMDWCDLDGAALLIYNGQGVNETINFYGGPFRFGDSIDGDSVSPPSTPVEIDLPFTVQTAQVVYSRARITLDDGRLSNFFRLGSAAVAAS